MDHTNLTLDEPDSLPKEDPKALFGEYFPKLVRFFSRLGHPVSDSEDLAQETMMRVFQGLSTVRHSFSQKSWIFTIAANMHRNELRSRQAVKRSAVETSVEEIEIAHLPHNALNPLDSALVDERARRLTEALEDLPAGMRNCVELRVFSDLKYREIADTLGISIGTVKIHLSRAREVLRERLKDISLPSDIS